jgi:hypothetical protein
MIMILNHCDYCCWPDLGGIRKAQLPGSNPGVAQILFFSEHLEMIDVIEGFIVDFLANASLGVPKAFGVTCNHPSLFGLAFSAPGFPNRSAKNGAKGTPGSAPLLRRRRFRV